MKKVVIPKPGGHNRLVLVNAEIPKPKKNEVLIKVHYAGINFADNAVRMGLYAAVKEHGGFPITPGFEYSGEVAALGEDVREWKVGQHVFGVTLFGGYAEYLCVDANYLFSIPEGLPLPEAAGFPAVYITAYYALHYLVRLRSEMKLLIHSAAGGVGSALIQIAKEAGCHATGVVGHSDKVARAKALGADEVIDKSKKDLWLEAERISPEGFDVVLDANGPSTLKQSYRHVRPSGVLISYGFHSLFPKKGGKPNWLRIAWDYLRTPRFHPVDMHHDNRSIMTFNLSFLFSRKDLLKEGMNFLIECFRLKKIAPVPVTIYPVEDVRKAHADLESGRTVGKLVLKM